MKMSYITAACRVITHRTMSRKPKPYPGAAGDRVILEQFFGGQCLPATPNHSEIPDFINLMIPLMKLALYNTSSKDFPTVS